MKILLVIVFTASCCCAFGQIYDTNNVVVQTFAGSGASDFKDGQGAQATFKNPSAIATDSAGNLFVLDAGNHRIGNVDASEAYNVRIRKITPDATVSTFAGGGVSQQPGYGSNVSLSGYPYYANPMSIMTIDRSNALWSAFFVSANGYFFFRVGSDAYVSFAPSIVSLPLGLCSDSKNNIYLSSGEGKQIYRSNTNWISMSSVRASTLASDAADNIHVWDLANFLIRKISQNMDVATIAGKFGVNTNSDGVAANASFSSVSAMTFDDVGNLVLACGTCIRKVTPAGSVTTIAGSFSKSGYSDGPGSNALFNGATGVCVSHGAIFVADSGNNRIRKITFTPIGQPVSGANLSLNLYPGLQISGTVGRTYRVESSTDMNIWREEAKILLPTSPYLWIDQDGVGAKKFYRAFLQP